jgi:hypothetical protein
LQRDIGALGRKLGSQGMESIFSAATVVTAPETFYGMERVEKR